MRRALDAATLASPSPNPPVGAVVVRDGAVVGVGHHARVGAPHAEAAALHEAGDRARGATLYVTLEPCNHLGRTPPCTEAIVRAGVARVVYAVDDPNPHVAGGGASRLREAGVEVVRGFDALQAEADALLAPWKTFITLGRPRVTLKLAMSLDGRIATRGRESRWITSAASRADGHALRAAHDAVLVGSGTVLADDPSLTVRDAPVRKAPVRVVVDGSLRTSADARIYDTRDAPTWLVTRRGHALSPFTDRGVTAIEVESDAQGHTSLGATLRALAERGVVSALCEGGGGLHGALVDGGFVDGVVAYLAPTILGGEGATMAVGGLGALGLGDALRLRWTDVRSLGDDVRLEGTR
ncbi:MAG: bifunctional diaminohydroxyphosphoribosylaminopyrimidine deaminase/5-amino-6-(5-phosphoribosylamino)uracil reductase RibD [Polyangiales bacterium]